MNNRMLQHLIERHNRTVNVLFLTLTVACTALIVAILALVK